jgi:outer membrane protein assembly factor BamE (lipoprotein component of BamABCDE complex)
MGIAFKLVNRRSLRLLALAALAAWLAGCDVPIDQRGNLPEESNLDQVKPGSTDKATVTRLLGSPSTVAEFDTDTWYYVSQKTKDVAFFRTDLLDQKVVAITFDKDGVVKDIATKGMQDRETITPDPHATPAPGREFSVIEQFLGNFGKFTNKAAKDSPSSGGP